MKMLDANTETTSPSIAEQAASAFKYWFCIILFLVGFLSGYFTHKYWAKKDAPPPVVAVVTPAQVGIDKIQVETLDSLKKDSIKQGFAQYDAETGLWRWKTPEEIHQRFQIQTIQQEAALFPDSLLPLPQQNEEKPKIPSKKK